MLYDTPYFSFLPNLQLTHAILRTMRIFRPPLLLCTPIWCCCLAAVPVAHSFAVERRRCVLLPWNTDESSTTDAWSARNEIGWTVEERDESNWKVTVSSRTKGGEQEDITVELPWKGLIDQNAADDEVSSDSSSSSSSYSSKDDLANSMWPPAIAGAILARYFDSNLLKDKRVMELGSGLGLLGWVAGAEAKAVTLTDHDDGAVSRLKQTIPKNQHLAALYEARYLEWRDDHSGSDDSNSFDVILGTDVAYYFYLLRPLMDTIQSHLVNDSGIAMVICQANRQSQWDLYDNLVKGSYNQLTDEHEGPWKGRTRMLLYRLQMHEWTDKTDSDDEVVHTILPIAVLLHERDEGATNFLHPGDYVATAKDQEEMLISF